MNSHRLDTAPAASTAIAATALPPFRARFPWLGGDLQTLRNMIVRPWLRFDDAPGQDLHFAMDDGTGDALLADLHEPAGAMTRPLAILIHGLTGDAESFYVLATARALLDQGFAVLRLNLRGAGRSAGTCREQYHAGRTADVVRVLAMLEPRLMRNGIVAVGYSLGANLLLKLVGETGQGAPFRAVAAVSPPADLAGAARCMLRPRNALYHRYLLRRMKAEARATKGGLAPALAAALARARSIVAYDDTVVAPRYGFASVADYYARCSGLGFAGSIRVPTLVVHARNDPWIPVLPFEDPVWRANPRLRLALSNSGGHVGFHGTCTTQAWHDALIARFFLDL